MYGYVAGMEKLHKINCVKENLKNMFKKYDNKNNEKYDIRSFLTDSGFQPDQQDRVLTGVVLDSDGKADIHG